MHIISHAFQNNGDIPRKYTCQGDNIEPPLSIADVPDNAKSLAIELRDPDAPSGDFVHWLIWNIDPKTAEIMENTTPAGALEGTNDANKVGYIGPCPPTGKHRYEFHLYALDGELNLSEESNKKVFREAIAEHIIEESVLVGLYEKKKTLESS